MVTKEDQGTLELERQSMKRRQNNERLLKGPLDGSVLLGRDDISQEPLYTTRFLISDRHAQRACVTRSVLYSVLLPCLQLGEVRTVCGCVWGILSSEIFLLLIHLTVVVLGLLKIFIHERHIDEVIHLSHAVCEAFLACCFIVIRAFKTKEKFHKVKATRLKVENVLTTGDSRSLAVKILTFFHVCNAFILCAFIAGMFVVFYIYSHLGWTILTNNAAILLSTLMFIVADERLTKMIDQIKLDQHKAVIYEASLLMSEMYWAITQEQQTMVKQQVEKFCKAVHATSLFVKPDYITCPETSKWDVITTMESGV